MPLVSVVIPAYNCSLYIKETIESILRQEGRSDIEVIVVNDGSTDHTGEIARQFGGAVRVIDQANAGVCVARNRGIREAKGDFMAFVDHDDYWLPGKLEIQMAAFAAHPQVDVVFSRFTRWQCDAKDGTFTDPSVFAAEALSPGFDPQYSGWIYHQMLLDSWVLTSTAVARSPAVIAVGGFDESLPYSEDWDFWLRVSRASQFLRLTAKTTLYRQHSSQGSRVIRAIDYRSRLLEGAARRWGLASRDGRRLTSRHFKRHLARCSVAFGLEHLTGETGADRSIAIKSLLKALSIDPFCWRGWAYLAATLMGWKNGNTTRVTS